MSKVKLQCPSDCKHLRNTYEPQLPKGWFCDVVKPTDLDHDGFGAALRRNKGCQYERGEKE